MSGTRIARPKAKPLTPEERAKIFKALSDEKRIDIVDALARNGAQCGTQLAEQLGISLALVCHHWEVLVDAGIVKKQRVGQLRVCTLDAERLAQATGTWSGIVASEPAKAAPKPRASKKKKAPTST